MIYNQLKPCCYKCRFSDITTDTNYWYSVDGRETKDSVIYCEHCHVCKYFNKENEND